MGKPLHISKDLDINLEDLIGQCIAILGIRGSGKSNTSGVIFEELLQNDYPLSIIDIEGEYFGLKEKYEVLVVGKGDGVEIEIDADCAGEIAQVSMEQNVPVVFDLSGFLSDERTEVLKAYLSALWNLAGTLRKPYMIGIEEAHEFIPQGVKNELKEMIARVALRGRKRGLGAIIVSQRSAKVDKDVLSQAGMLFLHRVVHEVDMRVYSELLPWRKSEVKEIINALDVGDCMYVNGDNVLPIYVRERSTFHAGFTPSLEAVKSPELRSVSASIIETIEKAREGKGPKSPTQQLESRIETMERLMDTKDQRIAELEDVARTLGYIKLEIPSFVSEGASPPVGQAEREARLAHSLPLVVAADDASMDIIESFHATSIAPHADASGVAVEPFVKGVSRTLPPAVNEHIERLISRFSREEILHRRVLAFLIEHSPGSYSTHQIAAWTRCPQELIDDDPPQGFLSSGLIARERRTSGIVYRSALRTFVNREFRVFQPDIGDNGLHYVTRLLRERLPMLA
ncbi:ATP-binding protein [Candidatus Bipolaricaulota bacterium]|nr:ATP-binding protein [Candidatus Bipolaricaulota bacterium]